MRVARLNVVIAVLALLVGSGSTLQAQSAEEIAKLEEARQANPDNVAAVRALGVAYYKLERFAEASEVLEHARTLAPKDRISALYAGLSAERVPDWTRARAAYNQYLEIKLPFYAFRARRTAEQIRNRLIAIAREESIARAKAAVAAEATLSATPGDPRTIAVPAMKYSGPNEAELAPLERGLAELVITDLGKSAQLVLVERDRMQALADEIQLGASGRVETESAVRAGHLIQAGRLVNGSIIQGGQALTLSSSIVTVATSQLSPPVEVNGDVDKFFDMQKELVFGIFEGLGVTLTAEERTAIGEQQTRNFDAFLLYSRGLVAVDAGRYAEAAALFKQSSALDPAFRAALSQATIAEAALAGSQVSAQTLESGLPRAERTPVSTAANAVAGVPTPPAPPIPLPLIGAIPSVSSILRLPAVPPSPIGSTLAMTAQSVNPPMVSVLSNATTRNAPPSAPLINPIENLFAGGGVFTLSNFSVILISRP